MYSDQPTIPSSVVTFRKELTRHPASQCRSSILTIFIRTHSLFSAGAPADGIHCVSTPTTVIARSEATTQSRSDGTRLLRGVYPRRRRPPTRGLAMTSTPEPEGI
jgi:hypothetical protein